MMLTRFSLSDGSCQGIFYRPTLHNAATQSPRVYSSFFGPLADGHSLAIEFQEVTVSLIVALFASRSPTTVSRPSFALALFAMAAGVMSVVVDSFYAVILSRALLHVLYKIVETISPTRANGDTTSAVIFVASQIFIFATCFHAAPSTVFWRATQSMHRLVLAIKFPRQATATLCSVVGKHVPAHRRIISALTLTKPKSRLPSILSNKTNYGKVTKDLVSQVVYSFAGKRDNFRQLPKGVVGSNCKEWELECMIGHGIDASRISTEQVAGHSRGVSAIFYVVLTPVIIPRMGVTNQ